MSPSAPLPRVAERPAPDPSHLAALFDTALDAMLLTSASGVVLAANDRAARLFRRTSDELSAYQLLDLTDQRDARVRLACIARHRSGRFAGEMRMRRADGTTFDAVVDSTAFRDADDRALCYVRVRPGLEPRTPGAPLPHLQLSDAGRVRDQHAQRLQGLGVQCGAIAHDFNNLLVGVLGNASLALELLSPDTESFQLVRDVERAARRAADLTRQLLTYAGRGEVVATSVDLSSVVAETAQLLRSVVGTRAELTVGCAEGLPPVEGDATQLRQIVMNLITNAADALDGRTGTITLRTGTTRVESDGSPSPWRDTAVADGAYVYLEVVDSGSGMTIETQRRIFDPHFSTRGVGRGLGLATTLGIVRAHRGAVSVDSTPGGGTTFRILLPVSTQARSVRPEGVQQKGVLQKGARQEGVRQEAAPSQPAAGEMVPLSIPSGEPLSREPVSPLPGQPAPGKPGRNTLGGPGGPARDGGLGVALVAVANGTVRSVARQMLQRRGFRVCTAATTEDALAVLAREQHALCVAVVDPVLSRSGSVSLAAAIGRACASARVVLLAGGDAEVSWRGVDTGRIAAALDLPFSSEDLHHAAGLDVVARVAR